MWPRCSRAAQLTAHQLGVLAVFFCMASGAAATDEGDPPGRVARLSDAEGWVSLQPAGVEQWTAATVNRPLTTGDRLWSDQNSRAELDIGEAVIRLGSNTGFAFLNLDDRSAQMQLSTGTLIVRVREMQTGQTYEIDAPNVAISLQKPGEYRAEVNERGDLTVIRVSQGAVLAAGADGQQVAIRAQEQVTVSGTSQVAYDSGGRGAPDDFDTWSAARERQFEDAASQEYVTGEVPGIQDLDDNGQWQETPEYGYVWIPIAVAVGWAPYRYGHWVWVAPWGWTWVDDAHWGFAPFHYGRWAQCGSRWCWVPCPRRVRPVYAPALVAWVGGASLGTSAYGGYVGWFPLAPHEVYVPAYRVSGNYLHTINRANTSRLNNTYITGVYENRITPTHYAHNRSAAVTAVPQSIFTSGQSAGTHAAALSTALLAEGVVTAAAPAIVPIHQSVLGAAEGHGVLKPPAARANRSVIARTSPPPAPANFETQLAAIQSNGGRALGGAEIAQLPRGAAIARVRVATSTGAVVAASALPHRSGTAGITVVREPTLADRERALQMSRLPPAPRAAGGSTPSGTGGYVSQPPTSGIDNVRPQSAQLQPTPRKSEPASIPAYRPPAASEAYAPEPETPRVEVSPRPLSRVAQPSSSAHRSAAPHTQPQKERESAARATRAPVERVTR
jgi:hypothetical protein